MSDAPHDDTLPIDGAPAFDHGDESSADYYLQLVVADWKNDRALQLCSLNARGLWLELMLICHKTGGFVRINGKAPGLKDIAAAVNSNQQDVANGLQELAQRGVFSLAKEDRAIVSRRIWRDAQKRKVDKTHGEKGGRPRKNPPVSGKQNPPVSENGNPYSQNYSYSQNQNQDIDGATSAPPTVLLTFSTVGSEPSWDLTSQHLAEWSEAYPNLDLLSECRKAKAWLDATPSRRKTPEGMPRFFVNWFNRATNGGSVQAHIRPARTQRVPTMAATLTWHEECERLHAGRCGNAIFHTAKVKEES